MSISTKNHFLSLLFSIVSAEAVKWIGIIVLIGSLAAEIVLILCVPSGSTEKVLSAICTAGIILGILFEELGVHEISRLEKAPRRDIIAGKESWVTDPLKSFSGISFDAGIGPNDKDVEDFLWDLEPCLWAAGWKQEDWTWPDGSKSGERRGASGRPTIATGQAASNVSVQIHPGSENAFGDAADALVAALNKNGIAAERHGFNIHNGNPKAMHILIGPRR
jgi:hypothetical protein